MWRSWTMLTKKLNSHPNIIKPTVSQNLPISHIIKEKYSQQSNKFQVGVFFFSFQVLFGQYLFCYLHYTCVMYIDLSLKFFE